MQIVHEMPMRLAYYKAQLNTSRTICHFSEASVTAELIYSIIVHLINKHSQSVHHSFGIHKN